MMFKRMLSMKYIWLTIPMLFIYSVSIAQTLTTNEPAPQKIWEVFLKVLFPAIWTYVAPQLTGLITSGMKKVPASLQVVISSVLGAVMAGAAGAIPDFPLTIESAATMGAAGGGTGQLLFNATPPKKDNSPTV